MTPQMMSQSQLQGQPRQGDDRGMSPPDRKRIRRNSGSAAASPYGAQPETPHQQPTPHPGNLPFNQAMAVQTQNQNMAQASLQAQQHAQQMQQQQQQMMQAHMGQGQQSQPPTPQTMAGQIDDQVRRSVQWMLLLLSTLTV